MTGLRRTTAALAVAALLFSVGGVARAAVHHHTPKASVPACVLGKQLVAGVSKAGPSSARSLAPTSPSPTAALPVR
jgi:hypothetical protein